MVKSKGPTWGFYTLVGNKGGVKCKYCSHSFKVPNVNKMTRHILKCFKCPTELKKPLKVSNTKCSDRKKSKTVVVHMATEVQNNLSNVSVSPNTPDVPSTSTNEQNAEPKNVPQKTPKLNQPQPKLLSFMDHMTPELNVTLQRSFARAVYVSGCPFSMATHPLWIAFFKDLRPTFTLPSPYQLSTTYLNDEYTKVQREVTEQLRHSQQLHLQCDGWSNCRNESIINFIISKPEPLFVDFVLTKEKRHEAPYLAELIENVLLKHDVNKFLVIIADNARNVKAALNINKAKYPHLVALGCLDHLLHLLCSDIVNCASVAAFFKNAVFVITSIKKSHILQALFVKIGNEKGPVKTRWGSKLYSAESLLKNKTVLQTLAVTEQAVPQNLKTILLDDSFWHKVEKMITILEPIVSLIKLLESNEPLIHIVISKFQLLGEILYEHLESSILQKEEQDYIFEQYEERKAFGIGAIHAAADLLSPSSQGKNLSASQLLDAMGFICDMANQMQIDAVTIRKELADFRERKGIWSRGFLWENLDSISPLVWWRNMQGVTPLAKIALRILSAPVTSAATERSFSTFSWIHSKKRNRLTSVRAGKLTFLSYNYKLMNPSTGRRRKRTKKSGHKTPSAKRTLTEPAEKQNESDSSVSTSKQDETIDDDIEIVTERSESESESGSESDQSDYDTEDLCDDSNSSNFEFSELDDEDDSE